MSERMKDEGARAIVRPDAIGSIQVLAIGVSRQSPATGLPTLPQCENNALAVRDCFKDYPQLFADASKVDALTSKGGTVSRGAIIGAVKELAAAAGPQNRLLVFISGHAHRINDKLYLVPEDAYDAEDASCLVEFEQLLTLMNSSRAIHKIAILDCCWSGPTSSSNKGSGPTEISQKFLSQYFGEIKGVAVLSSSAGSQTFDAKSPDPRYSLFSYHLKAALNGAVEALDGTCLTLQGLSTYVSDRLKLNSKSRRKAHDVVFESQSTEAILIGDFTPTLDRSPFALKHSPVHLVHFTDADRMTVKQVLPDMKRATYSAKYFQGLVNEKLPEHFETELGQVVARLKNDFDFPEDDVHVDGAGIRFPGGRYALEYVAEDGKSGSLMRLVTFSEAWFANPSEMADVLEVLELRPSEMKFELTRAIDLKDVLPGIKAAGWALTSQLHHKAEFAQGGFRLTIENETISFGGFLPSELFGISESKQSKLAGSVLMLLGD